MQPRVTVVLVARNGGDYLERTLAGLARQTRQPDTFVLVDVASTDGSSALLTSASPTQFVSVSGSRTTFGSAITQALRPIGPAESDDDWLWLLAHDTAPDPVALAKLLEAVEIAPSVAIAGPKLMRWDDSTTISEYGESMTRFGAAVKLVEDELDQGQHDGRSDVLAVAASGMLVRRRLWDRLAGFDPGLPSVDAALDFCVRARLAGHRVIGVPGARVSTAGGPELFGRKTVSGIARARLARAAQLHRRLVYAPIAAIALHWLSLVPLAVGRSVGHFLAKRPELVAGEITTAFAAAFGGGIYAARRNLKHTTTVRWSTIAPLRMPLAELREHRSTRREEIFAAAPVQPHIHPRFFSSSGIWVVIVCAIAGIVAFFPLIGATAVSGGGLLPLSASVGELWSHVGYGWRDINVGFTGASDPFAYVLAILGSLTFWQPSLSIVLVYVFALPLAALCAWLCAARLCQRGWAPAVAGILWAVSPPFISSLTSGHLGSAIAHIALPVLVLAAVNGARSWTAAAGASILFALVTASAPSLAPALLLCWIVWMLVQPTRAHRLAGMPIPALAIFAPLVATQLVRGNPLAVFADPGVPFADAAERANASAGWQLALGAPGADLSGWTDFLTRFGLPSAVAPFAVGAALAPLVILAALALFLPGIRRSAPALLIGLLGYLTAAVAVHIQLSSSGTSTVPIWSGSGLSLYWLGLIGAAIVTLETLRRAVVIPALLTILLGTVAASPLLSEPLLGTAVARASDGHILPALPTAESAHRPTVGTLVLSAHVGGLSASIERGSGTTLDDQSTLDATATTLLADQRSVAFLAGNLSTESGFDPKNELRRLGIGFVVVTAATDDASHTLQRTADALDASANFTPVGSGSGSLLWRTAVPVRSVKPSAGGNISTLQGVGVLAGQAIVFALALLLAAPTARRSRRSRRQTSGSHGLEGADAFGEGDHV